MNLENKKQIAIILLAIGLGLAAAALTGNHIQKSIKTETRKLSKEFENKKVKPLLREIEAMRKEMKQIASRQATASKSIGGSKKDAAPSVPKSSLALRTPAGKRAYTIRIDALAAVGGLVNPGDYIDIIAKMKMPNPGTGKQEDLTSMLFQNIQILAVGTNLQAPGGYDQQQKARALNLTLALTPQESSLITFVQQNGKLQLILRAPAETETQILQAATWPSLADYVFEKQGTELVIPRDRAVIEPVSGGGQEVKPFIQIYRGGREL